MFITDAIRTLSIDHGLGVGTIVKMGPGSEAAAVKVSELSSLPSQTNRHSGWRACRHQMAQWDLWLLQ